MFQTKIVPILDFKEGFIWNPLLMAYVGTCKKTLVNSNLLLLLFYLLLYGLILTSYLFKDTLLLYFYMSTFCTLTHSYYNSDARHFMIHYLI